ncbi:hypothetical protein LOTGIDRAFT_232409 [Lottia gigantea]|uniref:Large ribosomal subunit protein bL32m n=1 Tax=Lottia gigantea TaxID=225164 RepID=V4AG37_LOTGI|nr:hypothetical protein LOTGIDRAFT_232409 [Lottia gigantea]ESO94135.1 hypothetical protein LOTGIDRAFT_232409 [Lottia gigantea]
MAAPSSMTRLLVAFNRFERAFRQWIGIHPPAGFQGALVCDVHHIESNPNQTSGSMKSLLDDIFSNTLFAVPRNRRSKEIRRTRKMQITGHYEYALPKNNIVSCLECGHWHEKQTLCGNCYDKVRKETEEMQEAMGTDTLKYSQPQSEVMFLYEGEETENVKGKYVVKVDKERPGWFSKNLLTKRTIGGSDS